MDQVTQQNATLVEQTAAASRAMGDQAHELQQLMSFFKLGDDAATLNKVVAAPRSIPSVKPVLSAAHSPAKLLPVKQQPAAWRASVEKKPTPLSANAEEWEEF